MGEMLGYAVSSLFSVSPWMGSKTIQSQVKISRLENCPAVVPGIVNFPPVRTLGVVYVSYDGMLEPLGQSQVLGYLEHLAKIRPIHLVSFEKKSDLLFKARFELIAARIAAAGIHWHPLRYHKRPSALATAYDIFLGTLLGCWLVLRYRLQIVHARSYVASVIGLGIKRVTGARLIFDMRGFWADERVEGGIWPSGGLLYRIAKWFEREFFLAADHVVSLTRAGALEIQQFAFLNGRQPPLSVIPTCADLEHFRPIPAFQRDSSASKFILGYVGSAGTWYMFDAVVECFRQLLLMRPEAELLIVNRGEHDYINAVLNDAQIPDGSFNILQAEYTDVPKYMVKMDAAVFFYRPHFSKLATSPTRLGELLGCGVPCLTNTGIGDTSEVLQASKVGVAVPSFDSATLQAGIRRLLELCGDPSVTERCRSTALLHFSLVDGVAAYNDIYSRFDRSNSL